MPPPRTLQRRGIHPRNKTEFGRRLALAYARVEGLLPAGVVAQGPVAASAAVEDGGASVLLTLAPAPPAAGALALAPTADCFTDGRVPAPGNSSAHCCQNAATDPKGPHGFPFELEEEGGSGRFVLARATIVPPSAVRLAPLNASVALSGRVRYAWDSYPLCALVNGAQLPMAPFVGP